MKDRSPGPLPPEVVAEVVRHISDEKKTFLIGGQALNFWAERYAPNMPEITSFGPYMSKDVDFFGQADAAYRLAERIGGEVLVPDPDDQTPHSAIVKATVLGREVEIDFLWHVQGTPADKLQDQIVTIEVPVVINGMRTSAEISVMHPLHCLESRAANVIALKRNTNLAKRQLDASVHVVRGFVDEALQAGETRTASSVLKALAGYLLTDPVGVQVYEKTSANPLEIIRAFRNDERFDSRYRRNQIAGMIDAIEARQSQRAARSAARAAAINQGFGRS